MPALRKWDIFHYVYGLLHQPQYREKYADCLKKELPRIFFAPDFWAFAEGVGTSRIGTSTVVNCLP